MTADGAVAVTWRRFSRSTGEMSVLGRVFLILVAVALVTVVIIVATPQGRTAVTAALFVMQVLPIPVKPQELVSAPPTAERVDVAVTDGMANADIYSPAGAGPHPAVLLFLGVAPAGGDDERVVNLGQGLARAGIVAMFYWSPTMMEKRINPDDPANIAEAFRFLRDRQNVDPGRVGMAGFSVGAPFVLIAATDPELKEQVEYLHLFGSYFDTRDLLVAIASGTRFDVESTHPWEVNELSREVFEIALLETIDDLDERAAVGEAALAHSEPVDLTPEGEVVYRLLTRPSLDEARELVDQLPPEELEWLDRISARPYIEQVEAPLLLMHGEGDGHIPSEESRRMTAALKAHNKDVRHTEFALFGHMDPTEPVGVVTFVVDSGRLFAHVYRLLRFAG